MAEWQPIETAPRDGSEVLVCGPYDTACIVRWSERGQTWVGSFQNEDAVRSEGATYRDLFEVNVPTNLVWIPLPSPDGEKG